MLDILPEAPLKLTEAHVGRYYPYIARHMDDRALMPGFENIHTTPPSHIKGTRTDTNTHNTGPASLYLSIASNGT